MRLQARVFRFSLVLVLLLGVISKGFSATYTVTNREDESPATAGSLRRAVEQANQGPSADLIDFNIPGPGSSSITAIFGIYILDYPVEINGGGTQVIGGEDFSHEGGFFFNAGSEGSTVTGIALIADIRGIISYANCLRVYNCRIGTDWNDQDDLGSGGVISLEGDYNYVGGSTAGERNIIVNSTSYGISISGSYSIIQGNYIGLNSTGSVEIGNDIGINIAGHNNLIGGNRLTGEGNVISGSTDEGIVIGGSGNSVCGNIIGLNAAQTAAFPNDTGILLQNTSHDNWLGLPQPGKGNVISGNNNYGIYIQNANNNIVQNNIIGLSESDSGYANGTGIRIAGQNNMVGGYLNDVYHERNIISGNTNRGIEMSGNGNTISGNVIGLASDGVSVRGNANVGISHNFGNNLIGGWNQDQNNLRGNVVSGNGQYDIVCLGANAVVGNFIGTDATVTQIVPNINLARIYLSGTNILGGFNIQERNYICGNNQYGIRIANHNKSRVFSKMSG